MCLIASLKYMGLNILTLYRQENTIQMTHDDKNKPVGGTRRAQKLVMM